MSTEVIVIGGGLAGLTCALELSMQGKQVELFEAEHVVGGRTASWDEDGMKVESGFHRFIGYYRELPRMLKKSGVDVDKILKWEEQIDVIMPNKQRDNGENIIGTFGISPVQGPIRMIMGLIGNNQIIPAKDKLSLIPFFIKGFYDYFKNPKKLDSYSVYDYARSHGVEENAIHFLLIPLSTGIYFLPVEQYSAYVFFGMFFPAIPRFYTMRIGGFLGGMTEVMAQPMANRIEQLGGKIHTRAKAERLIVENDESVNGVIIENKEIHAESTVLATSLGAAQRIIKRSFKTIPSFFDQMMKLPSMSAVTMQIETTKPLLPYDRTTFGPKTSLASFAEESRTTFQKSNGRLSIILTPPERFLHMKHTEILEIVCKDAQDLGIPLNEHIKDYRVVSHPDDFHSLAPEHNWLRPPQKTTIKGLTLAGDYTQQPYFSTMEGATVSGIKAANDVIGSKNE